MSIDQVVFEIIKQAPELELHRYYLRDVLIRVKNEDCPEIKHVSYTYDDVHDYDLQMHICLGAYNVSVQLCRFQAGDEVLIDFNERAGMVSRWRF